MPKLKTRKSAEKRYKKTAQGKFIRKIAFKSHLLGKKSAKRKRRLSNKKLLKKSETFAIKKMLPY